MAETLLSFGIEKVWDLLVRESDRIKGVDEQLTELISDLEFLRSFLQDADAKKHANETVKSCVEQIKEIAFDTEDIIETFLLKEELAKTSGLKQRMRRLSCIIVDRRKVALDMEGISQRISKVIVRMKTLGVQQMSVNGREDVQRLEEKQREIRKTFPTSNEKYLVGLEKNVKKLVGYLVEEDSIQVVSIIGMGGLGKTTLARQVFNHQLVKSNFDRVAWICISQEFTRKDVWQTIFQKLCSKDDEERGSNMSEDELQEKLFRLLETSNSLIVLDDIWKEEDWGLIKDVFPPKKGWKILLTSRNEKVASCVDQTGVIFKLEYLSDEDSWNLFQMTAFPRKETSEYKVDAELEEMGKQMIKHCGGLPLAVIVLGGLLAEQYTLSEWERVFRNIKSHIVGATNFDEESISSVYHILHMSFEELPLYLKHCFLYLSPFPEDFTIHVERLAYYWAAEGIPRPKEYVGETIRDVADGYIAELVKRNIVISERDKLTSRFETCRLHDMMREVCLCKAQDENFLQIVHNTSTTNSKSLCKSRRLAVHLPNETFNQVEEMKNSKLRSLLIITNSLNGIEWMTSCICFKRLQLMRVLDLSWTKFKERKLPASIGKLIHLTYLSLNWTNVSHLPSSMQNLKKLLYLNLNVLSESPIYMPNFMKDMLELAYLYLPWNIEDEVKLELGNLVNLETLESFSTKNSSVKDLHQMTRLRTLSIMYTGGDCTMETLSSSLSELRHLENLEVYDYEKLALRNNEEGFVLDCNHLKHLCLEVYMPKLPDEQHFPSHLTTIDLVNCYLKEDPMPILEKLPQLQVVKLKNNSFCGKRIVCSVGGFPQLQELSLYGLEEWEEWIVEKDSMPLLHDLTIRYCPTLKQLPDGLRFLTSLKTVKIYFKDLNMKMEWKEILSVGGKDYYKVQHIPLINFY